VARADERALGGKPARDEAGLVRADRGEREDAFRGAIPSGSIEDDHFSRGQLRRAAADKPNASGIRSFFDALFFR